jgi:hypothetical protein
VRWTYGDVVFITLNINRQQQQPGPHAEMDAEYADRTAANLAWMRRAFELAARKPKQGGDDHRPR